VPVALSNGDVLLIVALATIPIAAIVFIVGAARAYREIGKGQFSVQFDSDLTQKWRDSSAEGGEADVGGEREAEMRQMLEAKAFRQRSRGEAEVDVEAELNRLLAEGEQAPLGSDAELREEVRQIVVARDQRRRRQGKEPLDIEAEVERQLRELENLGQ
jgi:hypothetical protein